MGQAQYSEASKQEHGLLEEQLLNRSKKQMPAKKVRKNQRMKKKSAAKGVALASLNGIKNIFGALKDSAVIVATNTRDTHVDVVKHREGETRAESTRTNWDITGQFTMGSLNTLQLMPGPTLAIRTGAWAVQSAIKFSPEQIKLLQGACYYEGYLMYRHALDGYILTYAKMRPCTLALYQSSHAADKDQLPRTYLLHQSTQDVRTYTNQDGKAFVIEVITPSHIWIFSPDYSTQTDVIWNPSIDLEQVTSTWVQGLKNLAAVQPNSQLK